MKDLNKVKLEIVGLSSGQSQGSYTLILGETEGRRKLPIIIGNFEAQAIAIQIEKIVPFRPMTHDLFISFGKAFDIEIIEVQINNLHEGVFYSSIICNHNGDIKEIDARTSDAIALAVCCNCPIYVDEEILETAGLTFEPEEEEEVAYRPPSLDPPPVRKASGEDLSVFATIELEKMLAKALSVEDYDRAARIRDELNRRK